MTVKKKVKAKKGTTKRAAPPRKVKSVTSAEQEQLSKPATDMGFHEVISHMETVHNDGSECAHDGVGQPETNTGTLPATNAPAVLPGNLKMPAVILLRDAKPNLSEDGSRIVSITGKCTEPVFDANGQPNGLCAIMRTIAVQDAFQVKRCIPHQKRAQHRKINERRKDARNAARAARDQTSVTT